MRSRYGTHCIVTCVVRFLVKESTLFLLSLVDRDGSAIDPWSRCDGVPRGCLGDPRRQWEVPIPWHNSTHCYFASTSGATRTHTSVACGVDTTYTYSISTSWAGSSDRGVILQKGSWIGPRGVTSWTCCGCPWLPRGWWGPTPWCWFSRGYYVSIWGRLDRGEWP